MWNDDYVHGLDTFLKTKRVLTILDCAGGTGFPSIKLKKLGWDISYSDKSQEMIDFFLKKLHKEKLSLPYYQSDWMGLRKNINSKFDTILCRGNSIVYVNSWENNGVTHNALADIKKSLIAFFDILNPGGLLYVDLMSGGEFNKPQYPFIETFEDKVIDGHNVSMTWRINHDTETKLRTVVIDLQVDGKAETFVLSSYLLSAGQLRVLLQETGFKDVGQEKIQGENNYDVFVGYK